MWPQDHVNRYFTACRLNQLGVVDFTYVPTWSGMAFTAFVTDVYSRRTVGWRTADRMPTELPLKALEMALGTRVGYSVFSRPVGGTMVCHQTSVGSLPRATFSGVTSPGAMYGSRSTVVESK